MKMMIGAAVCALMMLSAGAPALAQDADGDSYTFTITNSSESAIITFHLASESDSSWSEDLIPDTIIGAGESLEMEFAADADECRYATSVVMEDGTDYAAIVDYCDLTGIDISDDQGLTYY